MKATIAAVLLSVALLVAAPASASLISTVTLQQWLKTQLYTWNNEPHDIVGADCVKVDNDMSIFSCDLTLRDTFNSPPVDFEIEDIVLMVVSAHPITIVYCTEAHPCR